MVNLSRDHLVQLSCALIGSIQLSAMVLVALKTAVMAHLDLRHCYTALLQHILPVLSNPHNVFSLPLLQQKTVESMEAMPKMLMHILRHLKLPLSYPLTTPTQTGMNTVSRRN